MNAGVDSFAPLQPRDGLDKTLATRLGVILGLGALLCTLHWPVIASLLRRWNDTENKTYTHGYLVALITVGLLVRAGPRLAAIPSIPQPKALPFLLLSSLVSLIAYRAGILFACQVLLPIIWWTAILAACGGAIARGCLFPLGYFYFAVPVWGPINPLAQWGTVYAVRLMLQAVSIPAYFTENFVQVPAGTFEIAGGCSGQHFLVVGLAIAVLYGELRSDSWPARLKMAAWALALAAVANWVRVFVIIVSGHLTDMQGYLVRVSHYAFGWWVFAATMVIFFYVVAKFIPPPASAVATSSSAAAPTREPVLRTALIVTAVLAIAPLCHVFTAPTDRESATAGLLPTLEVGSWTGPTPIETDWRPILVGADSRELGGYVNKSYPAERIEAFEAQYASQDYDRKFSSYDNTLTGDWTVDASGRTSVAGIGVNELQVRDKHRHAALVWYFYAVGGRSFTDALAGQVWYGITSLYEVRTSTVFAARAYCIPDCEAARQRLGEFMKSAVPRVVDPARSQEVH